MKKKWLALLAAVLLLTGCTQEELEQDRKKMMEELPHQAYSGSREGSSDRTMSPEDRRDAAISRSQRQVERDAPNGAAAGRYRTDQGGRVYGQPGEGGSDLTKNARDIVDGVKENAEKIGEGLESAIRQGLKE